MWSPRWPNDDIENYKPVKHLKKAIKYVTGVEITYDLKVVISPEQGTNVTQKKQTLCGIGLLAEIVRKSQRLITYFSLRQKVYAVNMGSAPTSTKN